MKISIKKKVSRENNQENQKAFDDAKSLLTWNKFFMSALGLWPSCRCDVFFITIFFYLYCHVSFMFVYLYFTLRGLSLVKIIGTTVELITMAQVCLRLYIMRRYNGHYGEILEEFAKDFSVKNYSSEEERKIFLSYNRRSKFFIAVVILFLGLTAPLYFTQPLLRQLSLSKGTNVAKTFSYDLPYRIYLLYKITNTQIYIATYVSRIPIVYTIAFTQIAMDCLTLTIAAHLCGQFAILSIRIVNSDFIQEPRILHEIIKRHQKLIEVGLRLRKIYSICLLSHFLGATIAICIIVYQVLVSIAAGQKTNLVTFFVYGFLNIFRLYTLCWVGEYLIHESTNVANAYYQCRWYKLSVKDQKSIIVCIKRSQRRVSLRAGSFGDFSLEMFTNVMKTAMAYLSFLRNFI